MSLALINLEAEQSVLGALLLDADALAIVRPLLPAPAAFTGKSYDAVYAAILRLRDAGKPVEPTTLRTELLNAGITEAGPILADLVDAVPTAANVEFHARMVRDCWRRRQAETEAANLIRKLQEPSIPLEIALAESIAKLSADTDTPGKGAVRMLDSVFEWQAKFEAHEKGTAWPGIPTGLRTLDEMVGRWQPGRLIILAAAPKEGKTSLALAFARAATEDRNRAVLLASREMGDQELTERMISHAAGINVGKFQHRRATDHEFAEIVKASGSVGSRQILIDQWASTPALIHLAIQATQSKYPLDLLIVDYLQLLRSDGKPQNRDREIAEMTGALKHTARTLNIPILLLSQINRDSRKQERAPEMHDLRDSGAIEQDADQILMLHTVAKPESGPREVDLYVRGNRHGEIGKIPLRFWSWLGDWQEAERQLVAA
jgi:replicative DNA helicase